jgi:hypothetical protein
VISPPTKDRNPSEAEKQTPPVKIRGGANELERMFNAVPEVVTDEGILSRSWLPGETVDEIKRQNKPLKAGK